MNDELYRRLLQSIADREVSNHMDLWPSIQHAAKRRMQARQRKVSLLRTSVSTAAVVIVLLLMLITAAVSYAIVTYFADPGLENVNDAGLITPIGVTAQPTVAAAALDQQTANGITATLNWAYADGQRVVVNYTLEGLTPEMLNNRAYQIMPSLTYADGGFFNSALGGSTEPGEQPGSLINTPSFDYIESIPESGIFDLKLLIQGNRLQPDGAGQTTEWTFSFDLHLPVEAPRVLNPAQTVQANGLSVTLDTVRLSASGVQIALCYDLPDQPGDWVPHLEMTIDGQEGLYMGGGLIRDAQGSPIYPQPGDTRRCHTHDFHVAYTDESQTLILTVDWLENLPPEVVPQERLELAQARLAPQGIEVRFRQEDHGFGWDILRAPEGMTDEEAGMLVWDALKDQIPGPWVFTVDLR